MKACLAGRCAYGRQVVSDSAEWTGKLINQTQSCEENYAHGLAYYLWCNRGSNRMLVWVPEA